MSLDTIAQQYPAFAPLLKIPEIAQLLQEAATASPPWSLDQLGLKLMGTHWWKSTSKPARDWTYLKLVDPAEATRQSNANALAILEQAQTLGVPITLAQAADLADKSLANQWDANTLTYHVAQLAQQGKDRAGTITATQTTLRGVAADYGINVSDATTFNWAKNIAAGNADQKGFAEYAKNQALANHPYWEKQLNQGMTVRQLADPYLQTASHLLEISPDSIDLTKPKWNVAQPAAKGQDPKPMSQLEWSQHLMNDPQYGWDHTQNAKDSAFQVVDQLRQSFGAM